MIFINNKQNNQNQWCRPYRVSLLNQQLRQVGTILSGDTGNQSYFTIGHDDLLIEFNKRK